MNELEKIERETDLAISNTGIRRAIDVRSQLMQIPEVIKSLSYVDRQILKASTNIPIKEMPDEEFTTKVAALSRYILMDAGLRNASDYELTRFAAILRMYYSMFSLQDIRMAFELAMTGELDDFLPTDKNGKPDKNHYQSFNVEYISKILNAYKKRRGETEHKAYTALPQPKSQISPEKKAYYRWEMKRTVIVSFLAYKYRGKLPDNVNSFLIYAEIERLGLAEPIQVTEADKQEAVARLLRKAHTGVIKEFVAECIRHLQTKHSDVIAEAGLIAKEKALIKSFEAMANEEIQITDYIRLK